VLVDKKGNKTKWIFHSFKAPFFPYSPFFPFKP
jgi:hypothetical protein